MGEPIRVLQIVTQMNRGGIECLLMDLYRNLDRSRVQFDFYTCREEPGLFDAEIESLGGHIYYNPPLSLHGVDKRFATFFRAHPEYRIVHAQMNQWCGWILKGAKQAGVPVRIAHAHTALAGRSLKNMVKNWVKRSVNCTATHRFAVSKKAGAWLYGADNEFHVWPNPIDCEKFRFSPERRDQMRGILGLGDALTLIHVGNLRPEKNHPFLLDVFAEVRKRRPDTKLLSIGADYSNGTILRMAEEKGMLSGVQFLGLRSDVPELLQAGDVFVFPSRYEGFPGAVLEAQAAGLPCLISDTITDEVAITPLVVQFSITTAPSVWAEKVLTLCHTKREDTSKMIATAGFSLQQVTRDWEAFYMENWK